jgi:hypothetical protein
MSFGSPDLLIYAAATENSITDHNHLLDGSGHDIASDKNTKACAGKGMTDEGLCMSEVESVRFCGWVMSREGG